MMRPPLCLLVLSATVLHPASASDAICETSASVKSANSNEEYTNASAACSVAESNIVHQQWPRRLEEQEQEQEQRESSERTADGSSLSQLPGTVSTGVADDIDASKSSDDDHGDAKSSTSRLQQQQRQRQRRRRHTPNLIIRPVIHLTDISVREFNDEYSPPEKAVPIVFENLMDDVYDPADWTKEAIIKECGHIPLIDPEDEDCNGTSVSRDCHSVRYVNPSRIDQVWAGLQNANLTELNITTLGDMMRLQDTPAGSHLYLHDAPMRYYCPPGVDRIRVPKYFHTDYRHLEEEPDDHFPDIFISNKGTGSPLHADAHMTRFYFQLLSGKKLWRLLPPSEYWRAGPSIRDEDDYYPTKFGANIINPDFEKFPDLDGALVYEAVLNPGDVIFVPEGWGHQIYNLEDSMATSMNFVDWHALPAHLRFKRHEEGPEFELTYFYRLMTSYLMPVDIPVAPDEEENIDFQDWLDSHDFSTMDVSDSLIEFVEAREQIVHGIDSYRSTDGFPALHVAVKANYVAAVAYLIEHGASLHEQDYSALTAGELARLLEHDEIIEEIDRHLGDEEDDSEDGSEDDGEEEDDAADIIEG